MSHKPQDHPIVRIRKELDNIAYFTYSQTADPLQGVKARLPHLLRYVDALEAERNTLKQAWREKHQALNVATLRIAYLERMLEIAHDQNERDRSKIMELSTVAPPVWRSH